jgi:hypothetical protein
MGHSEGKMKITTVALAVALLVGWSARPTLAQEPPHYSPEQLDKLVARIALYPDPLLAQVLAASTFPDQIPDAAKWADEHHYLTGDELARTIADERLWWDPSVQALLPFPSVLGFGYEVDKRAGGSLPHAASYNYRRSRRWMGEQRAGGSGYRSENERR